MCLAIPARIVAICEGGYPLAVTESGGVQREVDISCLLLDRPAEDLLGCWVMVHVGVALACISEAEAQASLTLWQQLDADLTQ